MGQAVYRANIREASVTGDLHAVVMAVLGLDERPAASPGLARHPGLFNPIDLIRAQTVANGVAQRAILTRVAPIVRDVRAKLAEHPLVRRAGIQLRSFSGQAGQIPELVAAVTRAQRETVDVIAASTDAIINAQKEVGRAALLAYLNALGIHAPNQVAELYYFPADTNGNGQTIGIIELGGGYRQFDLQEYFALIGVPMPTMVDVSVAGGANRPPVKGRYEELNELYSSEVYLDIEVAGAMAPGARLVCYFAPLTNAGFIGALNAAIHDRANRPSAISISWSISEFAWLANPSLLACFEEVLKDAALLGITVCCAAGDYGATSEIPTGGFWVDYPSSSPYILSCGGTSILTSYNRVVAESAWNTLRQQGQATGGGVSAIFPQPSWQRGMNVPISLNLGTRLGRGVPDVAAVADPMTGYFLRVGDDWTVMAGTSAAAPFWCALLARISQSLAARVGYINPLLYKIASVKTFSDVVIGNNGGYFAGRGWDACTGIGSPLGANLRDALS
jgi:kumamolisin